MQRRDFLKKTAAVLSTTPLVTLPGAAAEQSIPATGIRIREKFITNDRAGVLALAQAIVGGRYRFLGSIPADFFVGFADLRDSPTDDSAWLLWADHGEQPWLLDFNLGESPFPGAEKEGFFTWLTAFHPRNCNDWLMVPTLYSRHIYDTKSINWRTPPVFPESENVDEILSTTRGVLLWQWQAERLIQHSCKLFRPSAMRLWHQYRRREEYAVQRVNEATCDGRSLADIIKERTVEETLDAGLPDYLLAGFLSEHMRLDAKASIGFL